MGPPTKPATALSVSARLMSHMKLISSMWLKPDPLGECGLPCRWRRGPWSPINVLLRRLIILFTLHHPRTSHVRPTWALWTSGARGKDHGPSPRHPQWMGGAHNGGWRVSMGTNQKAASFELNKPCRSGIWTEFSHWVNYRKDCMELC